MRTKTPALHSVSKAGQAFAVKKSRRKSAPSTRTHRILPEIYREQGLPDMPRAQLRRRKR